MKGAAYSVRDVAFSNFAVFAVVLVLLVFIRAHLELFLFDEIYLNNFKYTHYLFDYREEFIKRGLIGEMFRLVSAYPSRDSVAVVSYTALFILAFAFVHHFSAPQRKLPYRSEGALLFLLLAFLSPTTLQHFVYDIGRYDIFSIVLLSFSLWFVPKASDVSRFFVVTALMSAAVLIHEASFVICVPLVVAYWFTHSSNKVGIALQFSSFLTLTALTFAVSTYGLSTVYDLEHHVQILSKHYGENVASNSVRVLHNGSVSGNMLLTLSHAFDISRLKHHLAMFAFLTPLFIVIYKLVKGLVESGGVKVVVLFFAAISPLALYPLGHDHFRWWSLALTNIFLALACLGGDRVAFARQCAMILERNRGITMFAIVLGIITGPLQVTSSFDIAKLLSLAIWSII